MINAQTRALQCQHALVRRGLARHRRLLHTPASPPSSRPITNASHLAERLLAALYDCRASIPAWKPEPQPFSRFCGVVGRNGRRSHAGAKIKMVGNSPSGPKHLASISSSLAADDPETPHFTNANVTHHSYNIGYGFERVTRLEIGEFHGDHH